MYTPFLPSPQNLQVEAHFGCCSKGCSGVEWRWLAERRAQAKAEVKEAGQGRQPALAAQAKASSAASAKL